MAQTTLEHRTAWDKENMTTIGIKLANKRDAELIAFWKAQPNKADLFRRMLQKEMEGQTNDNNG